MAMTISGSLMELCVLALAAREDLYGYKMTQQMKNRFEISESSLYPVLRRLTRAGLLKTYDVPQDGRMRRYYALTEEGWKMLETYRKEWQEFSGNINDLVNLDPGLSQRRLSE